MLGDDIPSHIDLYKHKCGGPFTNDEEVEDVLNFILGSNCQATKHESVVLTNDNKDE